MISIDSLLVIPLNVDFIKKFPIEEDQTEQKIFIINLKQVFDPNHFKCEVYKKNFPT